MMTVTCEQPKGVSTEYGVSLSEYFDAHMEKRPESKPSFKKPKPDAFVGKPTFIVDSSKTKATVLWNETEEDAGLRKKAKEQGLPPVSPPSATEIAVISFSEHVVTAVEELVWGATVYSLFPKLGVTFITTQHVGANLNNAVQLSTFAFCEFSSRP